VVETFRDLPVLPFADAAAWDAWLAAHHRDQPGIWLKFAKKCAGTACVGKSDAIAVAIAHGWIDGQLQPWDEHFWLVRFTPRRPRAKWSENNVTVAERLMAEGRMHPAGLAEVERARADGRWTAAYAPQGRATVPDDLQAALDACPPAKAFFATLKGANRYAVLYRIGAVKTPAVRAAKIERFVAMLARGETLH
jgi:uncharacterized protein YdeI (YjbR/CyaY-like superfamily)